MLVLNQCEKGFKRAEYVVIIFKKKFSKNFSILPNGPNFW